MSGVQQQLVSCNEQAPCKMKLSTPPAAASSRTVLPSAAAAAAIASAFFSFSVWNQVLAGLL